MATGLEPLVLGSTVAGGAGGGASLIGTIAAGATLATTGASLLMSREQAKLDRATIEANRQEAKLAASEKALQNARGFRKALASQLALANFRGGPGSSIAAQFGGESMASFLADQQAIERGQKQIDTSATIQRAGATLGRTARDLATLSNFGSAALSFTNLSGPTDSRE